MDRRDQMTAGAAATRPTLTPLANEHLASPAVVRAPEAETALAAQIQDLSAAGDQDGARDLFSQIVARQQRRASRIAWHYLRDGAEADEAVQDAFMKAYTHIASFQRNLSFEVWFTRILINGCLDRQKARTRRSRWLLPVNDVAMHEHGFDRIADAGPLCFCVHNDRARHREIGLLVHINDADAVGMFDHGHARVNGFDDFVGGDRQHQARVQRRLVAALQAVPKAGNARSQR